MKTNQTLIFTNKSFFYTILGFTQSHSHPLDDIDGFYQLIAGCYKSDKPNNFTGIDKVHLKSDCIDGSIMNGTREPILYSFALDQPPGHKIYREPKVLYLYLLVLNTITFCLEDDNNEEVDFNGETLTFTLQMIKI